MSDESQKALCEKYQLAMLPPEDMVAVAMGSLGQSPVFGSRVQLSDGEDVSWFIHCGEHSDAADFYQAIHLHHLYEILPQVVKYLGLPVDAKFIIDDEGYEDVWTQ